MIKLPEGVSREETPLDHRYAAVLKGLLTRIRSLYEAVYERFGEEGLELIRTSGAQYGAGVAARVRKDGEPWDARRVGLYLVKVFDNMRSEGEVVEFSDRAVSIKVPRCPYPFRHPEICAAHTAMEAALVKGLNPQLDYTIDRCIPRGDEYCLHCIRVSAP